MPVISRFAWSKPMFLHLTQVTYLDNYRLALTFNNGQRGVADLRQDLNGGVFEALKEPRLFAQVKLDEELHTVAWPNGVDLAPEYLYFLAFQHDVTLHSLFKQWGYLEGEVNTPPASLWIDSYVM